MRRIFFIRHAKSSWKDEFLADIDRPLNKRGKRDAPFMAKKLAEKVPAVDLLITSSARRARDTSKYFAKKIEVSEKKVDENVYHAWTDTLIDIVREIPDKYETVLIFGHNPAFTAVYNSFSEHRLDNLPTCGIFEIQVEGSWSSLSKQKARTGLLLYPKLYDEAG